MGRATRDVAAAGVVVVEVEEAKVLRIGVGAVAWAAVGRVAVRPNEDVLVD